MPAEEAYVLSPADVKKIRSYVQHKYGEMPNEKRAEIVADAVHRIIVKQLPSFADDVKQHTVEKLIRSVVLERQSPVRKEDIFEVCLTLDRSSSAIMAPLAAWVNKELAISCGDKELATIMDELSTVPLKDGRGWELLQRKLALTGHTVGIANPKPSNAAAAEVIPMPLPAGMPKTVAHRKKLQTIMYSLLSLCLLSVLIMYGMSNAEFPAAESVKEEAPIAEAPPVEQAAPLEGLPKELRYTDINTDRLVSYLDAKSSILADQPYFDAIMKAARDFDIHPVLMFAITGQEQAFVPRTHARAEEIANNPFNVFHSWKDFNTNIYESAEIAARTVTNISKDRPEDADPITWINRTYAEDPNWSNGVRTIFNAIMRYIEEA